MGCQLTVTNQLLEAQRVQDVKLQQKLGLAHREAFAQKFPGQCEHIMRLIAERLQLGLRKDSAGLTNQEVEQLSTALSAIYHIHTQLTEPE